MALRSPSRLHRGSVGLAQAALADVALAESGTLGRSLAVRAPRSATELASEGGWTLSSVGRLVEICAAPDGAQTSAAVMVLREAQAEGDPVAWVMPRGAGLFPPDLAAAGLDLEALLVVHVPPEDRAAIPRAAELILRTGAFGAVVLDLRGGLEGARVHVPRGIAWQGRLLTLAREHACRVLVLSSEAEGQGSFGPLVSLRFDVRRRRLAPGCFRVEARVLKDKSGLARDVGRTCRAPLGLR